LTSSYPSGVFNNHGETIREHTLTGVPAVCKSSRRHRHMDSI